MIARQMVSYLTEGVIINAVNFPSVPIEIMGQLRPHLNLAERLGAFLGQVVRQPHDLVITYSGTVTEFDTRVLTHAVLKGLLGSFTDKPVNYVNAPSLAKDKGIKVEETISQDMKDYTNLIQVRMSGEKDEINEVWGTIFGRKHPRIVRLGQVHMDAVPEGTMLVIRNEDQPGVIGNIGATLAREGINIARFQLGRLEGRALCLVNVDMEPSEGVIENIRALPNILSVQKIHLS
jgi:D-3-phosphoglycerate dehydrogenase / 2-oxoglutarate reductase